MPNRPNIVVCSKDTTLENEWSQPDLHFEINLESAISTAKCYESKEVFIIGGAQLYKYAIDNNLVDRVLASEIKGFHKGDVFFPDVKKTGWKGTLFKEFKDFNVVEYVPS